MAPKTAAATSRAPRRSARLATRSPSVEREDPTTNNNIGAGRGHEVVFPHMEEESRRDERAGRRRLKMLEIERVARRVSEAETAQEQEQQQQQQQQAASPPRSGGGSPEQQRLLAVAPADPAPPPPTSAERRGWLSVLSSLFTRKRSAEEDGVAAPSPKRSRQEEPAAVAEPQQPPQLPREEAERTPRPVLTPKSPRDYTGPSKKNPKMPTSLSTITEYTEPSLLSNFPESLLESTPSRPPRVQPQNNLLQVPQNTPMRRTVTTPTMRRSAQLRAARAAGTATPTTGFPMRPATAPRPRETNADVRLAKLERLHTLQRELEELKQDEDIKAMQSHKLKRVKIDNLVEIPHNRPGDPSGCFRVPEEDSDDEMEVYDNVEERSNLFEELHTQAEDVIMQQEPTTEVPDASMEYIFPDVGRVPASYYVSEEFKDEAGRLFAAGFAEFLAVQSY